jgi:hypothetical protein
MGIQDHMKEVERKKTIKIGIWTRSSGATRILGTQSMRRSDYEYDKMRCSTIYDESTNGHGGI